MHRIRLFGIFGSLLLSSILLLTMFGCTAEEEKPTINIAEGNWTSSQIAAMVLGVSILYLVRFLET